jgi:lysophospholipase L1-like esterase
MLGMCRALACALAVACLTIPASPAIAQQPTNVEKIGWQVVSRYGGYADGDVRSDGDVRLDGVPKRFAGLDTFPVRIRPPEAICAARGQAEWTVDGRRRRGVELQGETDECRGEVAVEGEGRHRIAVRAGGTEAVADVDVNDELVVVLGDSVASGEGNPQSEGPKWLDPPCHRSSLAGFQQAAELVAQSLVHRSITFVSLACSGASIEEGLLGAYAGVKPEGKRTYEAQVTRLKQLGDVADGGHPVDAVMLSIGANDIEFSSLLKWCAAVHRCGTKSQREALDRNLARLNEGYGRLGERLKQAAPGAPVLIAEYFDPTHDAKGKFCRLSLGFIGRKAMKWAHDDVLVPLNNAVDAAASQPGWRQVGGIAEEFTRHGYCAGRAERWVVTLSESILHQRDHLGTFHPSAPGQAAIAGRLAPELYDALGLDSASPPPRAAGGGDGRGPRGPPVASIGGLTWYGALAVVVVAVLVAAAAWLTSVSGRPSDGILGALLLALLAVPALLVLLVFLAVLAVRLLRPTWRRDPCPAPRRRPSLAAAATSFSGRQLLILGGGIALLVALAVLFSGVVGGAILWARFWSSNLPADQSLDAVSRGEVLATGSQALAIFIGLGLAATIFAWLLDGRGQWVRSTRRGLAAIGVVELLVAVGLGDFRGHEAESIVVGLLIAALLLHFLVDRALEPASPFRSGNLLRALFEALGRWLRRFAHPSGRLVFGEALPLALLVAAVVFACSKEGGDRYLFVLVPLLLAAVCFAAPWGPAYPGVAFRDPDFARFEPPRIALATAGFACIAILLIRDEAWLAGAAAAAVLLGLVCLAVAAASGKRFAPYGLAVLVSVPLFGAAATLLHGVDSPELQPVAALLRGGRLVCGAYVGESEGRLWIGRVQLDERGGVNRPAEGAIFSIPSGRVASRVLGPLQPATGVESRAVELRDGLLGPRRGGALASRRPGCAPAAPAVRPVSSWQRRLALRYQPELVVDREDGFWPIPVKTLFSMRDSRGTICRRVAAGDNCLRLTTQGQFPWNGGEGESLEFPASDANAGDQHDLMVEALGSADPDRTATEYFLVSGRPGRGPITIQYWFFYSFNYQPVSSFDFGPLRGGVVKGGYHEGDWESVAVLLSGRTHRPRYFWMARHKGGRMLPWWDEDLAKLGDHPVVHAARGSHADYESCGTQLRYVAPWHLIDDHAACRPNDQLRLAPEVTALADLSRTPWQCWHGLFGQRAGRHAYESIPHFVDDAPLSPMWQQHYGGRRREPCRGVRDPGGRDGAGEETVEEAPPGAARPGVPARLRAGAARLDPAVDECADWERDPPPTGTTMIACDQEALGAYLGSGLEDPGAAGVRIDAAVRGSPEVGEATLPAIREERHGVYLDNWWLKAAEPSTVSVYATCRHGGQVIGARFAAVEVDPNRPLHLLDRGGKGGKWRLRTEGGATVAKAQPFAFVAKGEELVWGSPARGESAVCEG